MIKVNDRAGGRYGKRCVERRRNEYVIAGDTRVSGDVVAIRFSGRTVTSHTAPTDNWLLTTLQNHRDGLCEKQ